MHTLPDRKRPSNLGPDENPSISADFSVTIEAPAGLIPRPIYDRSPVPLELDRPDIPPCVRFVWIALDRSCRERGHFDKGTWKSARTLGIEAALGVEGQEFSESSVLTALRTLERLKFVSRSWVAIGDKMERMIWCHWRISPMMAPGARVNVGGVEVDCDRLMPGIHDAHKPRLFSRPKAAKKSGRAPETCGLLPPETPQKSGDNLNPQVELTEPLTGTATSSAREEDPKSIPIGPAMLPPPALIPDDDLPEPGLCRRHLRSLTKPEVAAVFVWGLIVRGLESEVPERFRGENRPARPTREIAPAPTAAPAPVVIPARVEPAVTGRFEDRKTETLVNNLVEVDPDQAERIVRIVADRLADDWHDHNSLGCFFARLREVASQDLSRDLFIKAMRAGYARKGRAKPGEGSPQGKAFNRILKARTIPIGTPRA